MAPRGDPRGERLAAAMPLRYRDVDHQAARLMAKSAWGASGAVHRDAVADAELASGDVDAGISAGPVWDGRRDVRLALLWGVKQSAAAAVEQHAAEPDTPVVGRSAV